MGQEDSGGAQPKPALWQTVEGWHQIFDAIQDLIFIHDADYRIVRANKAFADAIGRKTEDIVGKKCYEVVHRLDRPWPGCPFEKTRSDHQAHMLEVNDPHIGCPLLVTTSPIFDSENNFTGSVHIAKDITRQKNVERELRKNLAELKKFEEITIGREQKMIQLKREINKLCRELGREERYPLHD